MITEQLIEAIEIGLKSGLEKVKTNHPNLSLTDDEFHYLVSDICYQVDSVIEE